MEGAETTARVRETRGVPHTREKRLQSGSKGRLICDLVPKGPKRDSGGLLFFSLDPVLLIPFRATPTGAQASLSVRRRYAVTRFCAGPTFTHSG